MQVYRSVGDACEMGEMYRAYTDHRQSRGTVLRFRFGLELAVLERPLSRSNHGVKPIRGYSLECGVRDARDGLQDLYCSGPACMMPQQKGYIARLVAVLLLHVHMKPNAWAARKRGSVEERFTASGWRQRLKE